MQEHRPKKLIDQVRDAIRLKHYSYRTEQAYVVEVDVADEFIEAYGVKPDGNWEGKNILELRGTFEQRQRLADARAELFGARAARVHPGRDDKVLTSWNGLMLAAFAEAAAAFAVAEDGHERSERYRRIAEENADFLLQYLQTDTGRLFHTWKAAEGVVGQDGEGIAKVDGFLEDYANLAEGLLALYQLTFDPRWYQAAYDLIESALARLWVGGEGFYDTAADTEKLVIRPRDLQDNATPSGSAMAVTTLLKLAGFTKDLRYVNMAREALVQMQPMMAQYPLGFGQ